MTKRTIKQSLIVGTCKTAMADDIDRVLAWESHRMGILSEAVLKAAAVTAHDLESACRTLIAQYRSSGDFVLGGNLTNGPFLAIEDALKAIDGEPKP